MDPSSISTGRILMLIAYRILLPLVGVVIVIIGFMILSFDHSVYDQLVTSCNQGIQYACDKLGSAYWFMPR